MSRRRLLRAGALTGGGLLAATIAACTPAVSAARWTYGTRLAAGESASAVPGSTGAPAPALGGSIRRPVRGHVPCADGVERARPPTTTPTRRPPSTGSSAARPPRCPTGNQPLEPRMDGDVKVFELTVDEIEHQIDALRPPSRRARASTGRGRARGSTVAEGDTDPRDLHQQPGRVDRDPLPRPAPAERDGRRPAHHPGADPARRAVHLRVRRPGRPARTCTTRTTTPPTRSAAACSARSSSSRKDPAQRYDRLYGATQDIVWISNDTLGGFTINGRGFPATAPIVAKLGETIVIRFMNEGTMTHPWHLHGMPMRVVARDGYPLGSRRVHVRHPRASTRASAGTSSINCDEPGAWAFHCHILPHAEGPDGMYGMVTALVVQDATAASAQGRPGRRPSPA